MYRERTDPMKALFPEPPILKGADLSLEPLSLSDADSLHRLTRQETVYRYLPTFLFEKKYDDPVKVIRCLYDEALADSLILGIYREKRFCGLLEVYSYRAPIHKASIGYRLLQEEWGKGIATESLGIMMDELLNVRGIEIITASTMLQNHASAHVLEKNGFSLVSHAVEEDWGFPEPTLTDKWIR